MSEQATVQAINQRPATLQSGAIPDLDASCVEIRPKGATV